MSTENLWGPLPTNKDIKLPVTVLKEQAGILSDATSKILVAEVSVSKSGESVTYSLDIVAPALDNYRYQVLFVTHKAVAYPLQVFQVRGNPIKCSNEQEFLDVLKSILSSEKTHAVVSSLLAQSKAAA